MSGVIRCKHDCLVKTGVFKDNTVSLTFTDNCAIEISRKSFEDIAQGANFTHVFFSEKIDLETYKKEMADFFRNVSSYCTERFIMFIKTETWDSTKGRWFDREYHAGHR